MKVVFRNLVNKKISLELPQDKILGDIKESIYTSFKVDPKKKYIQLHYNGKLLQDSDTLNSIEYKENEPITVKTASIPKGNPSPKTLSPKKEQENSKPSPKQDKTIQKTQQTSPESSISTSVPVNQEEIDSKRPYPRIDAMQPYPIPNQAQEQIGTRSCSTIYTILDNNGKNLIFETLKNINPELYEKVQEDPEPFLLMLGFNINSFFSDHFSIDIREIRLNYSEEENESVERLIGLGYTEYKVIKIFEALGRNEKNTELILRNLQ